MGHTNDRKKAMRMTGQTYKIYWTPLGDKRIATLEPQTENMFVLISSVGFQRCDAFIQVQKGPRTTIQKDIKSKNSYRRPDVHTYGLIILPLRVFKPVDCGCMC